MQKALYFCKSEHKARLHRLVPNIHIALRVNVRPLANFELCKKVFVQLTAFFIPEQEALHYYTEHGCSISIIQLKHLLFAVTWTHYFAY